MRSRRARCQPSDLGLTPVGGRRRVPGLRREEPAAALSVDSEVGWGGGRGTAKPATWCRSCGWRPAARRATRGHHRYRHPIVGEFTLRYEAFSPPDMPDVALVCQLAEPGTPDAEALRLTRLVDCGAWAPRPGEPAAQVGCPAWPE